METLPDIRRSVKQKGTFDMYQDEKPQRDQQGNRMGRDRTRFDVTIGNDMYTCQPKRKAMYHVVICLCASGVTPEEIVEVAKIKRTCLFRSVDGSPSSAEFIERLVEAYKNGGRPFDPKRYYCKTGELIDSQDRTYAVHNQWGDSFKGVMNNLIQAFPDHNIVCKPSL